MIYITIILTNSKDQEFRFKIPLEKNPPKNKAIMEHLLKNNPDCYFTKYIISLF